jgi:hypothetical protein
MMSQKASEVYAKAAQAIKDANAQMEYSFDTLAPKMDEFITGVIGGMFDMATDPDVQAMGAINEQLASGFETRLAQLENFKERQAEIEKQISISSLSEAEKTAALQIAIEDSKRAVLLTGVGALLSASISLLTNGGKKQFQLYKGLAIAEATIATYTAANKVMAAFPGPAGQVMAAAYIVTGLARVRQIAMMKPGGSAGGGGSGGAGGFSANPTTGNQEFNNNTETEKNQPDKYTIIIENIHGSADEEFADMLADKIADRSVDGRDYGFATTN